MVTPFCWMHTSIAQPCNVIYVLSYSHLVILLTLYVGTHMLSDTALLCDTTTLRITFAQEAAAMTTCNNATMLHVGRCQPRSVEHSLAAEICSSSGSPQPAVQLLLKWQWLYVADVAEHDLSESQVPAWFLPVLLSHHWALDFMNINIS